MPLQSKVTPSATTAAISLLTCEYRLPSKTVLQRVATTATLHCVQLKKDLARLLGMVINAHLQKAITDLNHLNFICRPIFPPMILLLSLNDPLFRHLRLSLALEDVKKWIKNLFVD